jgi:hypothetical protein
MGEASMIAMTTKKRAVRNDDEETKQCSTYGNLSHLTARGNWQ